MLNKLRNAVLMVLGAMVALWAVTSVVDLVRAGPMEPSAPPGSTMLPLDELPPAWHQTLPANDGAPGPDPPAGCNSSRFKCVLTEGFMPVQYRGVLDKETGLVWTREATLGTPSNWAVAHDTCWDLDLVRSGWRLPTVEELMSLVDNSQFNPALPAGHPFISVTTNLYYWTATDYPDDPTSFMGVEMQNGYTFALGKASGGMRAVWCVRGGQGRVTE